MFIRITDIYSHTWLVNPKHVLWVSPGRYARDGQNVDGSYIMVGQDAIKSYTTVEELEEIFNGS